MKSRIDVQAYTKLLGSLLSSEVPSQLPATRELIFETLSAFLRTEYNFKRSLA
jgi:hypothetical protein